MHVNKLQKNFATLDEIKTQFENFSVLKFTFEVETNKTLNFLDVKITKSENRLKTSVYTKPTNEGDCINFHSIAPERYKMGVVKISSTELIKFAVTGRRVTQK